MNKVFRFTVPRALRDVAPFGNPALPTINPFTPQNDQFQISPAASPEILHHTVWRTWVFIAYSDERWLYYQFSLPHFIHFSLEGWENVLFEVGSERVSSLLSLWLSSREKQRRPQPSRKGPESRTEPYFCCWSAYPAVPVGFRWSTSGYKVHRKNRTLQSSSSWKWHWFGSDEWPRWSW